ncbi:uncharacterized protein LOC141646805 [Silene latifolia]|uniref:uncharacterized protein LOC141646805 n=1 Tax=Silene latifolia TaxID=37657 RepID=UPI003D76C3E8
MDESNTETTMNDIEKEGKDLLGKPTFEKLENGRFKCIETGHELPEHAKDSYSISKRCRMGLIDFALTHKKPPLNMFKLDPLNSSKLVCRLTGDTINKSEEHIWKHINGKRFFNKLEQVEAGFALVEGDGEGKSVKQEKAKNKKKKSKKKKEKQQEEIVSEMRDVPADSDSEETDFWVPPVGERWDFDDGGDRWGSDCESGDLPDDIDGADVENEAEQNATSEELSTRTKRMSIEIGPSSFASRKKKSKTKSP